MHPLPVPPTAEGVRKDTGLGQGIGGLLGPHPESSSEDPALAQLPMPWLMWREGPSLASSLASVWGFAKQAGNPSSCLRICRKARDCAHPQWGSPKGPTAARLAPRNQTWHRRAESKLERWVGCGRGRGTLGSGAFQKPPSGPHHAWVGSVPFPCPIPGWPLPPGLLGPPTAQPHPWVNTEPFETSKAQGERAGGKGGVGARV